MRFTSLAQYTRRYISRANNIRMGLYTLRTHAPTNNFTIQNKAHNFLVINRGANTFELNYCIISSDDDG